jgi:hypothetical protein
MCMSRAEVHRWYGDVTPWTEEQLDHYHGQHFGRQAWLDNRPFETLARAIAHKDPKDVGAIIAFADDAVNGDPRPDDLFHGQVEKLRKRLRT